jgi:hypothetical protein
VFTGIVFALKNKFEKKEKNKTYPIPNGPSSVARPGPPAPAQPASPP